MMKQRCSKHYREEKKWNKYNISFSLFVNIVQMLPAVIKIPKLSHNHYNNAWRCFLLAWQDTLRRCDSAVCGRKPIAMSCVRYGLAVERSQHTTLNYTETGGSRLEFEMGDTSRVSAVLLLPVLYLNNKYERYYGPGRRSLTYLLSYVITVSPAMCTINHYAPLIGCSVTASCIEL